MSPRFLLCLSSGDMLEASATKGSGSSKSSSPAARAREVSLSARADAVRAAGAGAVGSGVALDAEEFVALLPLYLLRPYFRCEFGPPLFFLLSVCPVSAFLCAWSLLPMFILSIFSSLFSFSLLLSALSFQN